MFACAHSYEPAAAGDEEEDGGGVSFALEGDQDADLDIYGSWRTRRALPREYFIEIMVVADAKMIDYHGPSLTSYILVLMNTVRTFTHIQPSKSRDKFSPKEVARVDAAPPRCL